MRLMDVKSAHYAYVVARAIEMRGGSTEGIKVTITCPECDQPTNYWGATDTGDHLVLALPNGQHMLLIGCEGYWIVDPGSVGLDRGNWTDTDGTTPTGTPRTCGHPGLVEDGRCNLGHGN